jgi:response regulator RpfG family c-di-GMP phosphodiesterase
MSQSLKIIIFVDDEFYMLQTYKALFRRDFLDAKMLFAQSGDEALDQLAEYGSETIDKLVVLSDWLMPGIKGDQLLIEIHQKYPMSQGFLLSGMISREPDADVYSKGNLKKIISKPWDNENLRSILKEALNE